MDSSIENQKQTTYEFYQLLNEVNHDPKYSNGFFCLFRLPNNIQAKWKNPPKPLNRFNKDPHELVEKAYHHKQYKNQPMNWFLSLNSMRSWKRGKNNVRRFNAFFLDVDCHDGDKTASSGRRSTKISQAEFMIDGYNQILKKAHIDLPTATENSGHGFYLIWLFPNGVPNNSKVMLYKWEHIEKRLLKAFNKACKSVLGEPLADPKATDPSRVLRVLGTKNVKDANNPQPCNLVDFDPSRLYSLDYWDKRFPNPTTNHHDYKGYGRKQHITHKHNHKHLTHNQRKQIKYKIHKLHKKIHVIDRPHRHSAWTLNRGLLHDLNLYLKDHGGNIHNVNITARELFLFLYATVLIKLVSGQPYHSESKDFYYSKYTVNIVMKHLNYINDNKFFDSTNHKNPLHSYDLHHLRIEMHKNPIISHNGKQKNFSFYNYSKNRIIDTLQISQLEQTHMKILVNGKVASKRHNKNFMKHLEHHHALGYIRRIKILYTKSHRNMLIAYYRYIKHQSYRQIANKISAGKSTIGNIINILESKPNTLGKIIRTLHEHQLSKKLVLYIGKAETDSPVIKISKEKDFEKLPDPILNKHYGAFVKSYEWYKRYMHESKASSMVSSEKASAPKDKSDGTLNSVSSAIKANSLSASQSSVQNQPNYNVANNINNRANSYGTNYDPSVIKALKFELKLISNGCGKDYLETNFENLPFIAHTLHKQKVSNDDYVKRAEDATLRTFINFDEWRDLPDLKQMFKASIDGGSPYTYRLDNVDLVFVKDTLHKLIDNYRLPVPLKFSYLGKCSKLEACYCYCLSFMFLTSVILATKYPTRFGWNYCRYLYDKLMNCKLFKANNFVRSKLIKIKDYVVYKYQAYSYGNYQQTE